MTALVADDVADLALSGEGQGYGCHGGVSGRFWKEATF
jgi:hypothetical protein